MKTSKAKNTSNPTENPTEIEHPPEEDQDRTPEQPGQNQNEGQGKQSQTTEAEIRPLAEKKERDPDWKGSKRSQYLLHKPRKYKSPEDFIERAQEYLESCFDDKGEIIQPITITGLCNYLGTTRERLLGYENGTLDSIQAVPGDDERWRDAVKRVKHVCQQYAENHGFMARNPAFAIFALKNYGWKDTQTIETTTTEIHTIDPETRQILQDYIDKLAQAQRMTVIDITPAPTRELVPVHNHVDNSDNG